MSGWPAVLGAVVLFGSYGVPLKSRRVVQAQADAIVLQLFKAVACFGSSLGVLLFKDFSWTWWALLGAALWVATGTLAIYAIQRAGLGLAQTVYSSLSVLVSYLWGVIAFHEMGRSAGMALLGLSLMVLGLAALGHTVHAAPRATLQRVPSAESTTFLDSLASKELQAQAVSLGLDGGSDGACTPRNGTLTPVGESEADPGPAPEPAGELSGTKRRSSGSSGALRAGEHLVRIGARLHHRSVSNGDLGGYAAGGWQEDPPNGGESDPTDALASWPAHTHGSNKDLEAAARSLRRRPPGELGIILRQNWLALRVRLGAAWGSQVGRGAMAAVLVGLLNGSFLVPFKLAGRRDQVQGVEYVLPFATASLLVTLLVCGVYYGLVRGRPPKLHSQAVAGPSLLTGALWSAGNLCSIWAVQSFGLSVGFPLVQCQLVVSAAWALLYYREVPANVRSLLLFVSATILVLAGMSLLAVYGAS